MGILDRNRPKLLENMTEVIPVIPKDISNEVNSVSVNDTSSEYETPRYDKMRNKVTQEFGPGIVGLSMEKDWLKSAELSLSLPNLSDGTEHLIKQHSPEREKAVRNSLSNIYNGHNNSENGNELASSNISTSLLRAKALSAEDCPSSSLDESNEFNREKAQHQLLMFAKESDKVLNCSKNNNGLSAVIENLPLICIPHTETVPENGCTGNINNSADTDDTLHSNGHINAENLSINDNIQSMDAIIESPDVTLTDISDGDVSANANLLESMENSPRQRAVSCTGSEISSTSVCSNSSNKSDNTVIDSYTTQVSSVHPTSTSRSRASEDDGDAESINELTKLHINASPIATSEKYEPVIREDGSSFSSVSSLSTNQSSDDIGESQTPTISAVTIPSEVTVGLEDEQGFVEINLNSSHNSRNSFEKCRNSASSQDNGIADVKAQQQLSPLQHTASSSLCSGAKPKRKGLAGFLTRNIFSRKSKELCPEEDGEDLGWKLFGKVPPKQAPEKDPAIISQEYQAKCRMPGPVSLVEGLKPSNRKKGDLEVLSTTALILENRPQGLPSKDPEEELRHRQMYEEMIEAAKKKEQRDAKQRKKQLVQQLKHEDIMATHLRIWNTEVLPNWETMSASRKVREMWWLGIPPSVRGKVWKLALGNDLNLTPELYHICLNRAKERLKLMEEWCGDTDSISSHMSGYSEHSASREASVELIKLDVSRTFPQLCIFQKGGPYHEHLQGLLGAYACYRPDVGYVQGMSFIAAVLLLNMEVEEAFMSFANLLNRPCQIAFFRLDENLMRSYFDTYEEFFAENLPRLWSHFKSQNLTSDLYIIDWMFTLYAKSLPLDVASRVWDVFCRDGEEFLFRTALGILKMYEEVLLNMDFIHLAQYLTKLPESIVCDELFRSIDFISMNMDKKTFSQVLAANRDSNRDNSGKESAQ